MTLLPSIEIIFVIIGLIFLAIAFKDYTKAGKSWSMSAKIRLRMGIIFIVVGIALSIFHKYMGT